MDKKGSLQDLILIGVILLFGSITILLGYKIVSEFDDKFQSSDVIAKYDTDNHARDASTTLKGYYPGVIDNTFLFLAIGLSIITIVLAALVRVHPMFIPLFFIGLIIVIFVMGILSNIYQEMAANPNLAEQAAQLTFIGHIMEYLPFIVGVFGFILMVIMYKLWKNAQ